MTAEARREKILNKLRQQKTPISAQTLAGEFRVSRQIIVGDIALLRAGGHQIAATPKGYVMESAAADTIYRIACVHTAEQMNRELQICVDQGCSILDVIVEHPVYGQLTGLLELDSRYDIEQFLKKVRSQSAHALSELTDGIHLHTLRCPDEDAYRRVMEQLKEEGILLSPKED